MPVVEYNFYAHRAMEGYYEVVGRAGAGYTGFDYERMKGLPPGPIANPGAASLQAALHPLDCDDYYFVSRNDGSHEFCPDLACHNAAVKRWQVNFFRERRAARARATKCSRGIISTSA